MSPTPPPTLQDPAPRLRQTTHPHPKIILDIHSAISNTEIRTLSLLAIIIAGSGLASSISLFRKWRQKTRSGVAAASRGDGVFALERMQAPRSRMQNVMGGWQKGVGSTGEGDMSGDWYQGCRSEEFEGEDGLGIHFVDVE